MAQVTRGQPSQAARAVQSSRQAARRHLAILEGAQLVHVERQGRLARLYSNPVPLQRLTSRWADARTKTWATGRWSTG